MRLIVVFFAAALAAIFTFKAFAGGPLIVVNENPVLWPSFRLPLQYAVDPGRLGPLSSAGARNVVDDSFEAWKAVNGSVFTFRRRDNLINEDVTLENFETITNSLPAGVVPVIFDDDGSIIEERFGSGSRFSILGGAFPRFTSTQLVSASIIYNGFFFRNRGLEADDIFVTMLHEAGHICGLDHTQHSRHYANNGVERDDAAFSAMYPTTSDNDVVRAVPSLDDRIALSNLYPNASFFSNSGRVTGRVRRGGSDLPGVNVILRETSDPFLNILTTVTGTFDDRSGTFELTGVPPGDYEVMVEPIDHIFNGASGVGQYSFDRNDLSFINPIRPEYFNDGDDTIEGRSAATVISVRENRTTGNINIQVESASFDDDEYRIGLLPVHGAMRGFTPGDGQGLSRQFMLFPSGDEGTLELRVEFDEAQNYVITIEQELPTGGLDRSDFSGEGSEDAIIFAPGGDLPLDEARYYISVATFGGDEAAYTLRVGEPAPEPTPTPQPTVTPDPTPESTFTPAPTETPEATPEPTRTPTPRDFVDVNRDGSHDSLDLFAFAQDWRLRHVIEARFDSFFDSDGTGTVNQGDLIGWLYRYRLSREAAVQRAFAESATPTPSAP